MTQFDFFKTIFRPPTQGMVLYIFSLASPHEKSVPPPDVPASQPDGDDPSWGLSAV